MKDSIQYRYEVSPRFFEQLRSCINSDLIPGLGNRRAQRLWERLLQAAEAGDPQAVYDWMRLGEFQRENSWKTPPPPIQRLLSLPHGEVRSALMEAIGRFGFPYPEFFRALQQEDWLRLLPASLLDTVIFPYHGTEPENERLVALAKLGHLEYVFRAFCRMRTSHLEPALSGLSRLGIHSRLLRIQAFLAARPEQPPVTTETVESDPSLDDALFEALGLKVSREGDELTLTAPHQPHDDMTIDFRCQKARASYARFDFSFRDGREFSSHPWDRDDRDPTPGTFDDFVFRHLLALAFQ